MFIQDLETPAVVLDKDRMAANITCFQDIADREDVRLRPHVKSTKCPQIWTEQAKAGAKGFTASTSKEAEAVMNTGEGREPFNDVLIAYPHVTPQALARIQALTRREGARIGLLVANEEGADIVRAHFGADSPEIYFAVDTGLHREGMLPNARAIQTVAHLRDLFGEKFIGILTHAGHVYKKTRPRNAQNIAASERDRMVSFARRCESAAGVRMREVSIGSTPTVHFFKNVPAGPNAVRVTEVRPGNYVFMDNIEVGLGVARPDECALSVMATVVDRKAVSKKIGPRNHVRRGRLILDAGSKVLSSDAKPHGLPGEKVFGRLYADFAAWALLEDSFVEAVSEEHGWVDVSPELLDVFKIGGKVRILVQHACPVVNLAGAGRGLYVAEGDRVVDNWPVVAAGH